MNQMSQKTTTQGYPKGAEPALPPRVKDHTGNSVGGQLATAFGDLAKLSDFQEKLMEEGLASSALTVRRTFIHIESCGQRLRRCVSDSDVCWDLRALSDTSRNSSKELEALEIANGKELSSLREATVDLE